MIPQVYFDKVKAYFKGDMAKTWKWFTTINPQLGGVTPLSMIKNGRLARLKLFLDKALDKDKRYYP